MPLLSPNQIHEVLKESTPQKELNSENPTLDKLLRKSNLTSEEVLEQVAIEMRTGDTSSARLGAAKLGLQLNGLLDAEQARPMQVTIVIQDSQFNQINPILIPR